MTIADELTSLLDQGIDLTTMGLPYGRRQHPDLDALPTALAYSNGWMDGLRAVLALMPLLTEGSVDRAEFMRRMYDPDVLPVTR